MADKILKVVFSGISTLYPHPPRKRNEPVPKKAFVLMAASTDEKETNDWGGTIDRHFPFVYVPLSQLEEPIPKPDDVVKDDKLGLCNIYFPANTRITFDPPPLEPLDYQIDEKHDLGERPGSDDVARHDDIRWLADLRALLPLNAKLKSSLDAPGPEVAAIVELTGGRFKAGFPCKSVQPQTFRAAGGETIPGIKRVLASEFFIEMKYPEATPSVKLQLWPLREGKSKTKDTPRTLTLRWREKDELVVHIGNDTKEEAALATSPERCNARVRSPSNQPVPRPRDDDFFLHYKLWNLTKKDPRPLPQAGPHQTAGDRCKPGG